jgi:hypothetical protein
MCVIKHHSREQYPKMEIGERRARHSSKKKARKSANDKTHQTT